MTTDLSAIKTPEIANVYLSPGQLFFSSEPTTLTTIVSSCVAVCLWDSTSGAGAVCHVQLPRWLGTGARSLSYADVAIQELLERMWALGAKPETTVAKLFGGACLTPHVRRRHKPLGDENVEHALAYLHASSIAVSEAATGGWRGRKLVFHTGDGSVRLQVL
jgi:chemotaxis protein CheD